MIKYCCDLCGKETNSMSYVPSGFEHLSKYIPKEMLLCPSCVDKFLDFVSQLDTDELYGGLKFNPDD